MTDVGYNSPQYGYGRVVPPQPVPPPPMPVPSEELEPAVASYDVDPAPGNAPPAVVQPTEPVNAEPVNAEPVGTQPVGTQPVGTQPVNAEPVNAEPVGTGPVSFDKAGESESLAASEPAVPGEPAAEAGSEAPVEAPVTAPVTAASDDDGPATPAGTASTSGRVAVQVVDRLRSTGERGTTTVPTPVIEKIATLAVREVPGVHEFAAGDSPDGERTLAIEVDGKTATVTLHLVIEYGFAVHSVTEKVRHKVISALENLFSLDVTAVDIVIDDIHLEDPAE